MQIVELGECSMVIMKDSEDPPWVSVGNIYRRAVNWHRPIIVDKGEQITTSYLVTSDCVYTAGRLVLFFKDAIPSRFKLHDKVYLTTL
jgi:hypothetical protein